MSNEESIPKDVADEDLVRAGQVAAWLSVSIKTVHNWADKGLLPAMVRRGPRIRLFKAGELRAALRKLDNRVKPKRRR